MVIDKTNPEHVNLPASLNGEVLLESSATGYVTCSIATANKNKNSLDPAWQQYKHIIDKVPNVN